MESKKDIVEFSIAKVNTEQFAIIEKAFVEKEEINLSTNLRFAVDSDQRIVAVFALFQFEQSEIPFLIVEVCCQFLIAQESWNPFVKDDFTTIIPKGFMTHLGMITVGTARGVLHSKTEGSKFNEFILPTINVAEMIQQDIEFKEVSKV